MFFCLCFCLVGFGGGVFCLFAFWLFGLGFFVFCFVVLLVWGVLLLVVGVFFCFFFVSLDSGLT